MTEIKKGLLWSGYSQISQTLLQLVSVFVLARILMPDDFGVLSIVAIFIAVGNMMVDSGMGGALLRMKNPSARDFSTLFVFNIVAGVVLYVLFFFGAIPLADYYDLPVLKDLLRVLSLSVVFNAFGIVQYVKLIYDLRFKELAIITFISTLVSVALAILGAVFGMGIWSLAIQQLSFSFFYNLQLWLKINYIPDFSFSVESFNAQKAFGFNVLGANLLNTLAENLNNNIVAKLVPIHQAGNFYQSNRLIITVDAGVRGVFDKVLFPVFAKIQDADELTNAFLEVFKKVIAVVVPLSVLLSLNADFAILIVLGSQWADAGWMIQVLALTLLPLVVITLSRNIFKAAGKTKTILHVEIFRSVLILGILFVTSLLGLTYIIWGILIGQVLVSLINIIYVANCLNVKLRDILQLVGSLVLPSLLAFAGSMLVAQLLTLENVILMFTAKTVIFAALLVVFSVGLRQYVLFDLVKVLIKKT